MPSDKLNHEMMLLYLAEARVAIDALQQQLLDPATERGDALALAVNYERVLYNIALSWHVGFLSTAEWESLSPAAYRRIGNRIPNFGFEFTLTNDIVPPPSR